MIDYDDKYHIIIIVIIECRYNVPTYIPTGITKMLETFCRCCNRLKYGFTLYGQYYSSIFANDLPTAHRV